MGTWEHLLNDPRANQMPMAGRHGRPAPITWRNWAPGMATSGKGIRLGSGDAGRNPALMAQLMANFQGAAGQPNVGGINAQANMYDQNPAMWSNKFNQQAGVNPNWFNSNFYQGGSPGDYGLTPGTGTMSGGALAPTANSNNNTSMGGGPPTTTQWGQSNGVGGSWNPNILPYIAPGQTGDTPGTYNSYQPMMPPTPTGAGTPYSGAPGTVMPSSGGTGYSDAATRFQTPSRPRHQYFTNPNDFRMR